MHGHTPYIRLQQPGATYNKKYHIGFPLSIHGGVYNTFYKSCLTIVTTKFCSTNLKHFADARSPKHNMHIILNSHDALVHIITQRAAIFPAKGFLLVSQ